MYDFLCLFPHANASHSLIHYLNQHKLMHVAPFTSIVRSLEDVSAYEKHFRPFVATLGVATKDYDVAETVKAILGATKRETVVQTVRDPVESFIAQTNNDFFVWRLKELLGEPFERWSVDRQIADAVTRYITPAAAEVAYEVDTFKRQILVDVEDLKGDKAEGTVRMLWRELCGNDDPANQISNVYKPIGARRFAQFRGRGFMKKFGDREIMVRPMIDGDLWVGNYGLHGGIFTAFETPIHTYPDASLIVPSLKLEGPLHIGVCSVQWYAMHPVQRAAIKDSLISQFEKSMRKFDPIYAEAERAMTFTEADLTPLQRDMLAAGIEQDFAVFHGRHPAIADRWVVTRRFSEFEDQGAWMGSFLCWTGFLIGIAPMRRAIHTNAMRFLAFLLVLTSVASAADSPATGSKDAGAAGYKHRTVDFRNDQPRPIQGMYAPQISPDGKQLAFTALGDIWIEDIDAETLAQKKPLKARRLFRDPALDLDAAWSPDGSQIAFVSDRETRPQIWLRNLTTNKERQLTTAPEQTAAPVWSPDSKRIAFFKVSTTTDFGKGRLNVVNVFTGDVKEVSHQMRPVTHVSWSQDGKTLAMNAVPPSASPSLPGRAPAQFLLMSLSGAPDRYVTPVPEGSTAGRGVNGPVWSPDGTKMAYVHDGLLWAVPVVPNGPKAGEITGPPSALTTELADAPSWTANSKSLLYLATDKLKRIDLDGETTDLQPNTGWHRNMPHVRMVVWAGRLWDGVAQTYRTNVDVVIDGNVISAVEPHQDGRKDAVVVNASRDTVLPGLIESKARMDAAMGNRLGRLWLGFGITSVLEPDADPYMALERRESWASGIRSGPREFFGASLDNAVKPAQLALEIGRAQQLGADLVRADFAAAAPLEKTIVAKAHEIGLPVFANVLYPRIGDGVDLIEDLGNGAAAYGDVIDLVAKTGATLTPAIAARGGYDLATLRNPALLQSEQVQKLFREEERNGLAAAVVKNQPMQASLQQSVAGLERAVHDIVARGGHIAAGSGAPDAPYGLSFLVELQLYQEAGLTPFQVLQAATSWPAAALGVDKDLGTVEAGKLADLLIVGGDPLKQVSDLIEMRGVVADGHYYLRDELLRAP